MPANEVNGAGPSPITFLNRFTVRASPADFERTFEETAAFMRDRPGYLGSTLLREVGREDSYVNIARWSDERSFRDALGHEDFPGHAAALRALSSSESALYQDPQ